MSDSTEKKEQDREEKLLDHNYDGIQELDNPLPNWWLIIFYVTIFFAIFYVSHYEFGSGLNLQEEYERSKQENDYKVALVQNKLPATDEKTLQALYEDKNQVLKGKEVFGKNCASCHGVEGQGIIGPNLTDEYWIHGKGQWMDLHQVVSNGVNEKGMPGWSSILKSEELQQVILYVKSLSGTHPANPKAPQGEKI